MKKSTLGVITMTLALCAVPQVHANGRPPRVILRFGTSYGVDGPFLGATNSIRGIPGDDLPWEVERIEGILLSSAILLSVSMAQGRAPDRGSVVDADGNAYRTVVIGE